MSSHCHPGPAPTRTHQGSRRLAALLVLSAALLAPGLAYWSGVGQPSPPAPTDLPACRTGSQLATRASYDDWAATLLDTEHRLPHTYVPPDLVDISHHGRTIRLRGLVIDDLSALLEAARRDGADVGLISGYRSHKRQAGVFAAAVQQHGHERAERLVARPGHSEHQLGTTLDLSGDHEWLAGHAWRYGFLLSYPARRSPALTCYDHEPWHYRYFGRERAAAIHASELSPREWLWREVQSTQSAAWPLVN